MAASLPRRVLGDYFTLQRGTTYKSRLLGMPGPVLLGLATIQRNGGFRRDSLQTYGGDSPDKLLVNPGELYLSLKDVTQSADLLGAVSRLPRDHPPGRLTQDTVKLEPKCPDVPLDYLYWLLRTPQYRAYCRSHATGTTNLGLARDDFLAFPAPEPTPEQLEIVDTITALHDKIELNRRMSETLEAMARALFKSWFVDFNPVRAKAEGRAPGLPKSLADLFPARLVDSELGEIPEGWKVVLLSDLTTVITKGTTPTQEDVETAPQDDPVVRYVRVNAIDGFGEVLFDKLTTIPESVHLGVLKRSVLRAGDVLYTIAGTIGRVSIVGESLLPANTNQAVAVIRPRSNIPSAFLALAMRQEAFREELHSNIVQAVQANLSLGMLSRATVAVPPEAVLLELFAPSEALVGRATLARAQSRTLGALRDLLLPKLISGELTSVRPKAEAEATQ